MEQFIELNKEYILAFCVYTLGICIAVAIMKLVKSNKSE
jgi:hypothetical protein